MLFYSIRCSYSSSLISLHRPSHFRKFGQVKDYSSRLNYNASKINNSVPREGGYSAGTSFDLRCYAFVCVYNFVRFEFFLTTSTFEFAVIYKLIIMKFNWRITFISIIIYYYIISDEEHLNSTVNILFRSVKCIVYSCMRI